MAYKKKPHGIYSTSRTVISVLQSRRLTVPIWRHWAKDFAIELVMQKGQHTCMAHDCADFQSTSRWGCDGGRSSDQKRVQDPICFEVSLVVIGLSRCHLPTAQVQWQHMWLYSIRPGDALPTRSWCDAAHQTQHSKHEYCVSETSCGTARTERSSQDTIISGNFIAGSIVHTFLTVPSN